MTQYIYLKIVLILNSLLHGALTHLRSHTPWYEGYETAYRRHTGLLQSFWTNQETLCHPLMFFICEECKPERQRGSWKNSYLFFNPHGLITRKTHIHLWTNKQITDTKGVDWPKAYFESPLKIWYFKYTELLKLFSLPILLLFTIFPYSLKLWDAEYPGMLSLFQTDERVGLGRSDCLQYRHTHNGVRLVGINREYNTEIPIFALI